MARQQTGTTVVQNADGSHSRVPVYKTTPERVTFNRPSGVPLNHPYGGDEAVNIRLAYVDGVYVGALYGLDPSPYHGSPTRYAFVPARPGNPTHATAFTSSRLSDARVDIERYIDSRPTSS